MQGELNVDAGFWGGIVPDNAGHHTTLQAMVDAGVLGFKSFMIPSGAATRQPCDHHALLQPLKDL
jgi:allantoinase